MEKPLIVCVRGPAHVNSRCSTQVPGKVDGMLSTVLSGAYQFICTVGPFDRSLELRVDDDGDGDGSGVDLVARDAAHAYDLLSEGYRAGRIVDYSKALAGIEGIRKFKTPSYCNSGRFHGIEKELLEGDGRVTVCYDIASYKGGPFVHLLIKDIENALDVENEQTCASLFLSGDTSASKTGLMKAVVGSMFGKGVVEVNDLESISGCNEHLLSRDPDLVLLMDDTEFAITANGTKASTASIKGVLEQGDSQAKRGVGCRAGKNFKIRLSISYQKAWDL